jgi:hypothetical protein
MDGAQAVIRDNWGVTTAETAAWLEISILRRWCTPLVQQPLLRHVNRH